MRSRCRYPLQFCVVQYLHADYPSSSAFNDEQCANVEPVDIHVVARFIELRSHPRSFRRL